MKLLSGPLKSASTEGEVTVGAEPDGEKNAARTQQLLLISLDSGKEGDGAGDADRGGTSGETCPEVGSFRDRQRNKRPGNYSVNGITTEGERGKKERSEN